MKGFIELTVVNYNSEGYKILIKLEQIKCIKEYRNIPSTVIKSEVHYDKEDVIFVYESLNEIKNLIKEAINGN